MRFVLSLMSVLFPREGTAERPQRGGKTRFVLRFWFGKEGASCQTEEGWEPSVARGHKENGLFPLRYPLPAPKRPLFMAESDLILCICFIYLITVLNESFSKKNFKTKRFNCYRCSNRSSLYLNIVVLEASWFVFLFI